MQIRERYQKFAGFKFEGETFTFRRVPFGLRNSGAALFRCMGNIIKDQFKENVTVYVDIFIATKTFQEHLKIITDLFQILSQNNIVLNIEKSNSCKEIVKFVGYEISERGFNMCKSNIEQIEKLPRPKNVRQLRGFLGLIRYYSRFF